MIAKEFYHKSINRATQQTPILIQFNSIANEPTILFLSTQFYYRNELWLDHQKTFWIILEYGNFLEDQLEFSDCKMPDYQNFTAS